MQWWTEWSSTVILIIGVALTATNVYPLNVVFSLTGNIGWGIVGFMWRKTSLIVIQIIMSAIYIVGVFFTLGVK